MISIPEEIDFYQQVLILIQQNADTPFTESFLETFELSIPSVPLMTVQRVLKSHNYSLHDDKIHLLLCAYVDLFKSHCVHNHLASVACIGELHRLLAPQWPYFIWLRSSTYLLNTHDVPRLLFGFEYEKLAWTDTGSRLCPMSIFLQNSTEWEIYEHKKSVHLFLVKPKFNP